MTVGCVHTVGEAITSTGLSLRSCEAPNQYAPVVRDPYADIAEPNVEGPCISQTEKNTTTFQPNFNHSSGVRALRICGLCLECGGNSLAAISEWFDLHLIRLRGQVSWARWVG